MRGFWRSNERDYRWRDGTEYCIEEQLVLSCPDVVGRIGASDVAGCNCYGWTLMSAIYEAHEVKPNKECMKLKFPGTVVGGNEFQWCLSCNIDRDNGVQRRRRDVMGGGGR